MHRLRAHSPPRHSANLSLMSRIHRTLDFPSWLLNWCSQWGPPMSHPGPLQANYWLLRRMCPHESFLLPISAPSSRCSRPVCRRCLLIENWSFVLRDTVALGTKPAQQPWQQLAKLHQWRYWILYPQSMWFCALNVNSSYPYSRSCEKFRPPSTNTLPGITAFLQEMQWVINKYRQP